VRFVGTPTKTIAKDLHATPSYPNLLPNPVLTMRFTIPILINLAFSNVASAQGCPDGGTACGYFGFLCCTGDEVCVTDANNHAICSVPALSSSTPVVSMGSGEVMSTSVVVGSSDSDGVTVTEAPIPMTTSTRTQVTGVETSSSDTVVVDATGTSLLSSSTAQSADTSVTSASASTTGAESTVSTGSADASDAQASTTTGAGGRVERSWYGVVGVGVIVATVLMG